MSLAHSLAHRLDSRLMALQTIERALLSPTAIAVHDDGNVLGNARSIERFGVESRRRVGENDI